VINVTGPAALFRGMQIREKGELIGLYTVAAGLGSLAGALLGGLLADVIGFRALFAVAAA
jgi:MFS family permease